MKIILDPGSTHDGDFSKACSLVKIAAECGADAIKFQLLTENETKGGNILLPWHWLPDLIASGKKIGIEVFASVFDEAGRDWVRNCGCESIKYAYSQRHKVEPEHHMVVYCSRDVMDPDISSFEESDCLVQLYCVAEYPVKSILDFEGIFPRFDGFSSHCLGMEQEIRAVEAGAKFLEFHFQGDWESPTPDGRFAKSPQLTKSLISRIRNMTAPARYDGREFS